MKSLETSYLLKEGEITEWVSFLYYLKKRGKTPQSQHMFVASILNVHFLRKKRSFVICMTSKLFTLFKRVKKTVLLALGIR